MSSSYILPTPRTLDPMSPRSVFEPLPPDLERRIAERWKVWEPWVRIHLSRAHQSEPTVDPAVDGGDPTRLRQRHSALIIAMMRAGISMSTIRRHRLDDPRQLTGASLQEIGRQFGGRHHTTVLHSINKVEAMLRVDEAVSRTIRRLVDAAVSRT